MFQLTGNGIEWLVDIGFHAELPTFDADKSTPERNGLFGLEPITGLEPAVPARKAVNGLLPLDELPQSLVSATLYQENNAGNAGELKNQKTAMKIKKKKNNK